MLALIAGPSSIMWVSLVLVTVGYLICLLRILYSWGVIASAMALVCGVLGLLSSSHYLLFTWFGGAINALPGLLGLPLVYIASLGILGYHDRIPLFKASLLLAGVCAALLLWDGQRVWPAVFHGVKASLMGYPDLVLHAGEDLGEHVPPAGTRVIFKPTGDALSCGLHAEPEPLRPALPYTATCRDYFWGKEMISPDYAAYADLPPLHGLARLWVEERPGELSLSVFSDLDTLTITDLQRLCSEEGDCQQSKQLIAGLLDMEAWSEVVAWSLDAEQPLKVSLWQAPRRERQAMFQALDKDVREQLGTRVAGIVAVYAEAQANSLALRDMRPTYPNPWSDSFTPFSQRNSAGKWAVLRTISQKLPVEISEIGRVSGLRDAVLIAVEQRQDGGVRLVYHTGVGRQTAWGMMFFAAPFLWLIILLLLVTWRCVRGPCSRTKCGS